MAGDMTPSQVEDAVERGVLTPVLRGVYVFGEPLLAQRELLRAATLAAGPVSALSGLSAAEALEIVRPRLGFATVVTSRRGMRSLVKTLVPVESKSPGLITTRFTTDLRFTEGNGLPLVRAARMFTEIATERGPRALERAWREADYRRLLDLADIEADLLRSHRAGGGVVRDLLERMPRPLDSSIETRSRSEVDVLRLIREAGLPEPLVNAPVVINGSSYYADFLWVELGLVLEVDDPSHRRFLAAQRDKLRDSDFFVHGLDVIRMETEVLQRDPNGCMSQLALAVERQRLRVPAAGSCGNRA